MIVLIDPCHRIVYSSFYIQGLIELVGPTSIRFSSKGFEGLNQKSETHGFDHYFAFIVKDKFGDKRIIIDFRDKRSIKEIAYNWCDVYSKINYHKESTPEKFHSKTISIPPSFGVKIWGLFETILFAISNLLKTNFRLSTSVHLFMASYKGQYLRPKHFDYLLNESVVKNYVFFISSIWNHENCINETNPRRAEFVKLCKQHNSLMFEGGLFIYQEVDEKSPYFKLRINKRYSYQDYLQLTKRSMFVFNTPAVFNCHGWKLGEFLAMGKAIISYPISNDLPAPLIHKENIYIVNNFEELQIAINELINDPNLRLKLEIGSRAYYKKWCSPLSVIKNILCYYGE